MLVLVAFMLVLVLVAFMLMLVLVAFMLMLVLVAFVAVATMTGFNRMSYYSLFYNRLYMLSNIMSFFQACISLHNNSNLCKQRIPRSAEQYSSYLNNTSNCRSRPLNIIH